MCSAGRHNDSQHAGKSLQINILLIAEERSKHCVRWGGGGADFGVAHEISLSLAPDYKRYKSPPRGGQVTFVLGGPTQTRGPFVAGTDFSMLRKVCHVERWVFL